MNLKIKCFRKLFIVSFLLIVLSHQLFAQRFKGEILAGCNFSQVDGDMEVGYKKLGFRGGLGAMLPFSFDKYNPEKNWAFSMEILYNQKGARQRQFDYNQDSNSVGFGTKFKYKLRLDYVSVPIMLHYHHRNIWSIAAGFQYNRIVYLHEIEFDKLQTYDTVNRPKANDWSVIVDVRVRIWQQLKAGFRFEYSMAPIRTRHFIETTYYIEQTRKQFNNSLSIYLVFLLNEKKTENKNKIPKTKDRTYYY